MTDTAPAADGASSGGPVVPASTYQLLRDRLRGTAAHLRDAADRLNGDRSGVFASVPLALAEQDRLRTEQPSLPRDVVSVGGRLLFGFNAGAQLGRGRHVGDAFDVFDVAHNGANDWAFTHVALDDPTSLLADAAFRRDLGELFTYFADARLISLRRTGDRLLMVFSVGTSADDVRVMRWACDPKNPDVAPTYIDAYGDNDLVDSHPYDFAWVDCGRERIVEGRWRHYSIEGALFIGFDRGRLDFRIDDVVQGGRSVHSESVAHEQELDEVKVGFAFLGDVLLVRVLPYRESAERFYIYNRLTRSITRADAVGRNCHQLPEGQGVVFPGGYHLQNGDTKVFTLPVASAGDTVGFAFHAAHRSPNGEDILYSYHRRSTGEYLLCAYNVVTRTMASPIVTDGYAVFDDGTIITIRHADEPQRVHAINVYTSPFCTVEHYAPAVAGDSFFGRIGNPELVRVLGEALSLARDCVDPQFNQAVFEAFVQRSTALLDAHPWVSQPEAHGIGEHLVALRKTAGDVLDEFAAVVVAKQEANARLGDAERAVADLVADAELELRDAATYIDRLARARGVIGALAVLGDVREIDDAAVAQLRTRTEGVYATLSQRAVEFLAGDDALSEVLAVFDAAERAAPTLATSSQVAERATLVDEAGGRVVLLTEVVGGLETADVTAKTAVLTRLSDALARRNASRATLDARAATLRTSELSAAFVAAMSVLSQRSQAALMAAADAAACDAALATLTAELENADLQYGTVPEYADAIDAKRAELVAAFTQRRDGLAGERTRRIDRIAQSAQRVIETIIARATALPDRAAVDTYFSTDPLVAKVRTSCDELRHLGEAGRAGEIDVALSTARDQARRVVADRAELFEAGTVKIGRWKFGVNREPFELRLDVVGDGDAAEPQLRLTGTDLVVPVSEALLGEDLTIAAQIYPTETTAMARAVYLAIDALLGGVAVADVPAFAAGRIDDGYEPGVHDADAQRIVAALAGWWAEPGVRLSGATRAVAGAWVVAHDGPQRAALERECRALASLGAGRSLDDFHRRVAPQLAELAASAGLAADPSFDAQLACGAVIDRCSGVALVSESAWARREQLRDWAAGVGVEARTAGFATLMRWAADLGDCPNGVAAQAAWALLDSGCTSTAVTDQVVVDGLRSRHGTIDGGALTILAGDVYVSTIVYRRDGLARFRAFNERRRALLARQRVELDLDRLKPTVISSFVRNRLVDEVYLPLIGDNIARQIGLNGAAQGLLLLISPPGYGKTTLLEYIADLLGCALVKINGPALGEAVVSLDPAAAPDAAAADELVKLNRAMAMGNNVICMIDDIQHTSPEFLQKFISLCDATRRIEGVIDGDARTFSLSGKRFVMAMAGNPYTSSGAAFRIPDMLANRADVYNLGDMAAAAADAFAQSYVENACGVNEELAPVLGRSRHDLQILLQAAAGATIRSDELQHRYSASELSRVISTLGHLLRVRDVLLKVNAAYIRSATVDDNLRGEPPFLLQGSYRNMARIAQRVLPAMTPAEVDALVADHYRVESQTLAAAAGWNLAKLAEVLGTADDRALADLDTLRQRWREANVGGDPLAVMANALTGIAAAMAPARDASPAELPVGKATRPKR